MIDRLPYQAIGAQGVALALYRLRKAGYAAFEVGEGFPFDILVNRESQPVRVQCKTTAAMPGSGGDYNFIISKGRYAPSTHSAKPLTPYEGGEIDVMALIAIHAEKCLFIPAKAAVGLTRLSIPAALMESDQGDNLSFGESLRGVSVLH